MPDDPFAVRQVDQLRVEIASLETSLELVMAQLAGLPTRVEAARITLLATAAVGVGLGLLGMLLLGAGH